MSLENTDTNSDYEKLPIPDGDHSFRVVSVNRVEKVPGLYEWEFTAEDGNTYEVGIFKTEMGNLLRVLGCNETDKGKFSWDTVEVEGKSFAAIAYQIVDKKDSSKMRQKLKDFKPSEKDVKSSGIPF